VIARLYNKNVTLANHNTVFIMATYQINMGQVRKNLSYTMFSEHLATKDKTIEDTLSCNIDIQMLQDKITRIHKNSMIRDYLYQAVNNFVVDYQVGNFGKTHPYVEECIQGMMRATQKKIYNLYANFDNDRFRQDEMVEDKGENHDYYYEPRESEVNTWRCSIRNELEKVQFVFKGEMEEMKTNAQKMKREEFILCSSYSDFFEEHTKKEATMKMARNEKQMSSEDSKKRKQPP